MVRLDPVLREKFDRYNDLLIKRGFYNGCEKGSDEYNDRAAKAKARFLSKYAQEQQEAAAAAAASSSSSSAPAPAPAAASTPKSSGLSEAEKTEKAEALKNDGNSKLASRQFNEAIALYSEAISLNPRNAIYYSNRAAAYSHIGEHQKAISDCNAAIKLDPKYSKAYSRLGLAYFSLGKYREAVEFGYRKALELEPNNATARESLAAAEAKIAESDAASQTAAPAAMPEMPGMPGMPGMGAGGNPLAGLNPDFIRQAMGAFGGAGAGAGGAPGGMPDLGGLAGLMSNPQFASMAQNLMSNPAFMNMFVEDSHSLHHPRKRTDRTRIFSDFAQCRAQSLASNPDVLRSVGSMFGGQPPAGGNNGNNNDDDDAMNL